MLPAGAQAVKPQQLLVLIVGPSGDRIAPEENQVVERLNRLRSEAGLTQLQMGTMHWDRPAEARFVRDTLGVDRNDLVAVALVQLDSQGRPHKPLHVERKVTAARIDAAQEQVLRRWSQLSGVSLPMAVSAPVVVPRPVPGAEVMTSEGILNVARQTETLANQLWEDLRNRPLRDDRKDVALRSALFGLVEHSRLLRIAMEEGLVNPVERFQRTLRSGDDLKAGEPQYYLPVDLRGREKPLFQSLEQLRRAYAQLNAR